MAEAYEQRLDREFTTNPPNRDDRRVFDVYKIEMLGKIRIFTDALSSVLDEPHRKEVLTKVHQYLQNGIPYKNPEVFDGAMGRLKELRVEGVNSEVTKESLLTYFKAAAFQENVVKKAQQLVRKVPLFLSTKMFYWTYVIPYAGLIDNSEVTLFSKIIDELSNPLIDFHDYLLSDSYNRGIAVEKAKGLSEMAQKYISEMKTKVPNSYFLRDTKYFLERLTNFSSWLSETDKRMLLLFLPGELFGTIETNDETVGLIREMFEADLTDNELELIRNGIKCYEQKGFLRDLKDAVVGDRGVRTNKLEAFSSYIAYNQLAKNLALPILNLDEISKSRPKNLAYILREKYRVYLTEKSVDGLLGDSILDDLYLNGGSKPPKSSVKPPWENPNRVMKISLTDVGYERVDLDKLCVNISSIIGKAVKLTKKPRRFYHQNKNLIEKIKKEEAEPSEIKIVLANLRADLSETDRLPLVEGEFLSLLGELNDNNLLKMAGVSAKDNRSLYLKYWERNFDLDSVSGQGYHCCFSSGDIARYIENQNTSIYEVWNSSYRFGGIFLLNTLLNDESPAFTIDSIECHPRLFSMVSDKFGLDYVTSVNKVIDRVVRGVSLEATSQNKKLVIAPHSNLKEIKVALREICKKYGSDILTFKREKSRTDIKFEFLPKQIDLQKMNNLT